MLGDMRHRYCRRVLDKIHLAPEIIIITGKINSGKSAYLEELVTEEKSLGQTPTGIMARGIFKAQNKIGYDVIDIASEASMPLARIFPFADSDIRSGKFYFSKTAFDFGKEALLNFKPDGIVFVDEVGPLELAGKGYAECLRRLLQSRISKLYVVVRKELLSDFSEMFMGGGPAKIIET
jgi:nucleoside-triphosphatase THEP1